MAPYAPQDPEFEARVRGSFANLTLMRTVGARLLRVAPGEVEIDLQFRDDLTQHHGFLARAVVTAIVDVACGYAAMTLMPPGASVLTIEYKVNFLSRAQGERLIARGRVVRPRRTVTVCAGDVVALIEGGRRPLRPCWQRWRRSLPRAESSHGPRPLPHRPMIARVACTSGGRHGRPAARACAGARDWVDA
jgi:uncharacterized protein (TIGR00369 family)